MDAHQAHGPAQIAAYPHPFLQQASKGALGACFLNGSVPGQGDFSCLPKSVRVGRGTVCCLRGQGGSQIFVDKRGLVRGCLSLWRVNSSLRGSLTQNKCGRQRPCVSLCQ